MQKNNSSSDARWWLKPEFESGGDLAKLFSAVNRTVIPAKAGRNYRRFFFYAKLGEPLKI